MNKLGFGFLHLPMNSDGNVDLPALNGLVDAYLAGGKNYFDSAYTYLDGKSELALRESLVRRYPRDRFRIATKLPGYTVKAPEDCARLFEEQLARCGVDYFDVYMLHWLNEKNYRIAEKFGEFTFLKELKAAGKAKQIGFSFHDSAALLDEILTAHPEVDLVLIQLNYVDWESESIQSRRCYETIVRHGKRVLVMEPVKGGTLASPPEAAARELARIDPTASPASLAIRFAESLPGVDVVLSGMNASDQVLDNLRERAPLTEEDRAVFAKAAEIINSSTAIPCSGCGYCLKGCPKQIRIPNYFRLYNELMRNPGEDWKILPAYVHLRTVCGAPADCITCRQCEHHCPQGLPVVSLLRQVHEKFGSS